MSTEEFRDLMLLHIFDVEKREDVKEYHLTEEDWKRVYEIRDEYFGNWDWNYGESPKFEIQTRRRFPIGSIDFHFNISAAKIVEARIYGDFFGLGEISDVEEALVGTKYTRDDLREVFNNIDLKKYFGNVTADDLVEALFSEKQ